MTRKAPRTREQVHFEKIGWAKPLTKQIESICSMLPQTTVDRAYRDNRLADPLPNDFVRVAIPKLAFLEQMFKPENPEMAWDIYTMIGVAIEDICSRLKIKRPTFENCRKGELGPDRVICDGEMALRRREDELSVPGDILILDINIGNFLGNRSTCYNAYDSRQMILANEALMGLSAVDLGWILLINNRLLTRWEELSIDSTLEWYCMPDLGWSCKLHYYYYSRLEFGFGRGSFASPEHASAVAMRPGRRLSR